MDNLYFIELKEKPNTFVLSNNGNISMYSKDFRFINGKQTYYFSISILGQYFCFIHPMISTRDIFWGEITEILISELHYFPILTEGVIKETNTFYSENKTVNSLCRLLECIGFDVRATNQYLPCIKYRTCYCPILSYGYNSKVLISFDIMEGIRKYGYSNMDNNVRRILYAEPIEVKECEIAGIPKHDGVTFRWNGILCTKVYHRSIRAYVYYHSKDILMRCTDLGIIKYDYIKNIFDVLKKELEGVKKKGHNYIFKELFSSLKQFRRSEFKNCSAEIVYASIAKALSELLKYGITI